jgi:predicted ATPase
MAAIEVEAALASASHALKTLGVNMPQKLSYGHVALKLWKIKRMLRHKTDEDILSLPTMVNQSMSAAIKLLIHVCSHSLMNASIKQGVYSALLAAELTLRFGLSPYSATSLAVYGMTEVMLGNYDKAYRFGELALTLLQRIECRAVECLTVITARKICMFRKEPLQAIPGPLLRAAELGFEIGEMAYVRVL